MFGASGSGPGGVYQETATTMHTDTIETRTEFLATPQFGFAHLRGSLTHIEPIHDFLVVQFGAVAEMVAAAGAAPRGVIQASCPGGAR